MEVEIVEDLGSGMRIDLMTTCEPEKKKTQNSIIKEEIASQELAMTNPGFPITFFENDRP